MSFLNIKNLKERDVTIEDYLAMKEHIENRNLADRNNFIEQQRYLEQEYEQIVASNREMTEKITDELMPI